MRVLTVIPITNNQYLEDLTYFSLKDVPLGSVVDIKIRNKEVPALVIKSVDASDMKAILRGNSFSLKRLSSTESRELLTPAFIKAAEYTAKYYATTVGSIIFAMIPKAVLVCKNIKVIPKLDTFKRYTHDAYALQTNTDDRITMYKNIAREALSRGRSIVFVSTGPISANKLYKELCNGIENKTHVLHSKISKKGLLNTITKISNLNKAIVLIATPKFATINIHNLRTMLIDDEGSSNYHTLKQPFLDTTIFLSEYAKKMRIKLILSATVLSTRTQLAMRNGEMTELMPLSTRQRSTVKVKIIDPRKKTKEPIGKKSDKTLKKFNAIDTELKKVIKTIVAKKQSILILVPRNGLAPTTVCRDCSSTMMCDNCDTPIMLHKTGDNTREYLCARCGLTKDPDTTCTYCNSWRLETLGLGIELIEEELQKIIGKNNIIKIDKKNTKTDNEVIRAVDKFNTKGGILLATQLAIPFIDKVDTCIVVSLDAMLSVPSFNIDERIFSLLLKLKELTSNSMYIQTRMPERNVLTLAMTGDISEFMREELKLRKELKYPPYTIMIKLITTGSKKQIINNLHNAIPYLKPYAPRVFKEFHRLSGNKFALHTLIRIESTKWPNDTLSNLLKSLQTKFEIRINLD